MYPQLKKPRARMEEARRLLEVRCLMQRGESLDSCGGAELGGASGVNGDSAALLRLDIHTA
eukprot:2967552-Rhodomonas_salina.1